jgi:hypothetical protein
MEQMKEELGQRQKVELEVVEGQSVFCEGKELAPLLATLGTRNVEIRAWAQATSVSSLLFAPLAPSEGTSEHAECHREAPRD